MTLMTMCQLKNGNTYEKSGIETCSDQCCDKEINMELPMDKTCLDSIFKTCWMTSYLEHLIIDSSQYEKEECVNIKDYNCWGLVFIDDDAIPEMVFLCACEASGKAILTFYNGHVSKWNSWRNGVDFIPRKGFVRNNDGSMGHYYDRFIRLKKGVFSAYLIHDLNEDEHSMYTIFNGDTVCRGFSEYCEIWEREKNKFESQPYIEIEKIQTYPIDMLYKYLKSRCDM